MMKIISHRGYWKFDSEKNTQIAFKRSFLMGFGTETDVRDYRGSLVISHDIATSENMLFKDFIKMVFTLANNRPITLALNIKADGLAAHVALALNEHPNLDCFAFDMSVPDMRDYLNHGVPVFTRMSEVEQQSVWLDRSSGVWLDGFDFDWFSNKLILEILNQNKRVCIVSPELHRRKYDDLWKRIRPLAEDPRLMLCTDYPEQAQEYFFNY